MRTKNMDMENQEDKRKEDDKRREAAISSTPYLRPNFNPNGVTKEQVVKFQELHRRRLQMKSKSNFKSKIHKRRKDSSTISCEKEDLMTKICENKESSVMIESSSAPCMENDDNNNISNPLHRGSKSVHLAPLKRQKLHWGLDAKERWERKANM